jgi:hypothetical protein
LPTLFVNTKEQPVTLQIGVKVKTPTKIYLKVVDADKPLTSYTNRFATIEDCNDFFVRMPISPRRAQIIIKSENELDGSKDLTYKIVTAKKLPLKTKLEAINMNPTIRRFVKFCQDFCKRASYVSAKGSIYTSDDGQFRIDYLDDIVGANGKSLKTPARISRTEGIIEVSKSKFLNYTVPMRMAILLHEFSHFYLNQDMANETEADLNGLLVYLGLGYPRIDAYNVFTQVFATSPSGLNKERFEVIDNFIQNFDKTFIDLSYEDSYLYSKFD